MSTTTTQTVDPSTLKAGDRVTFTFAEKDFDTTLVEVEGPTSGGRFLRATTSPHDGYLPYVVTASPSGVPEIAYGIENLRLAPVNPSTFKAGDRVTFTFGRRDFDTTLTRTGASAWNLRAATHPGWDGYLPTVIVCEEGGTPEVAYGIGNLRLVEAAEVEVTVPEPGEVERLR